MDFGSWIERSAKRIVHLKAAADLVCKHKSVLLDVTMPPTPEPNNQQVAANHIVANETIAHRIGAGIAT